MTADYVYTAADCEAQGKETDPKQAAGAKSGKSVSQFSANYTLLSFLLLSWNKVRNSQQRL